MAFALRNHMNLNFCGQGPKEQSSVIGLHRRSISAAHAMSALVSLQFPVYKSSPILTLTLQLKSPSAPISELDHILGVYTQPASGCGRIVVPACTVFAYALFDYLSHYSIFHPAHLSHILLCLILRVLATPHTSFRTTAVATCMVIILFVAVISLARWSFTWSKGSSRQARSPPSLFSRQ